MSRTKCFLASLCLALLGSLAARVTTPGLPADAYHLIFNIAGAAAFFCLRPDCLADLFRQARNVAYVIRNT